uniref:ACT domain-containing protein n=1 Tax=Fervidicoccus fontis TaxID=683846 RepID=A0A7J3ZN36_9CREN
MKKASCTFLTPLPTNKQRFSSSIEPGLYSKYLLEKSGDTVGNSVLKTLRSRFARQIDVKEALSLPSGKKSSEKISVAEAVRIIVSTSLPLQECLRAGVVNYTWASEKIMSNIAKLTGKKKVSIDAVKAALIRYQQELESEGRAELERVSSIIAKSTIELQNDISVLTVRKFAIERHIAEIFSVASEARFFNLTQGRKTYTITISSEDAGRILSKIGKEDLLELLNDQAAIVLISPQEITVTPGVVSFVSRTLFVRGINITQIISCHTDTIIVVRKQQAVDALKALEEGIEACRKCGGTSTNSGTFRGDDHVFSQS